MKMIRLLATLLLMTLFPAVSALCAVGTPLPKPDVLSEEEVFTPERLSGYDTIVIRDFKTESAEYSNVDDEEKPKIENMKPMLVRIVSESLEMELKNRKLFKHIQKSGDAKGKALVLEGEFIEYNAGNRAVRFWVGFGAGKTYLKIKGRLVDAETGKELATFIDRETGYKGSMTMESFDGLFPHQAKSIGENLAKFIEQLY